MALAGGLGLGGGREEGEKGQGGSWGRSPAAARAEAVRGGLATTAGGRRWPWAGVPEVRRRSRRGGKALGDPVESIPPLTLGSGGLWTALHGGGRQWTEKLAAVALQS